MGTVSTEVLTDLTAFAARMAETRDDPRSKTNDPRVLLYSSIASVASGSAGAVATQLAAIDRSRLSEGDQQLLDAARAVAEKVIAIPNVPPAPAKGVLSIVYVCTAEKGAGARPALPQAARSLNSSARIACIHEARRGSSLSTQAIEALG